jgi:dipeptidyl aminopeptidase/acylaminoacyl peptidase
MNNSQTWGTENCGARTRPRRHRRWASPALWLCALLGLPVSGYAVPLEVYGSLPSIEDLALSPDGTRLAFVRTKGEARSIVIVSLPEGHPITSVQMGDHKLRDITWADSRHLLITTSEFGAFYGAADSVWLDESEWSRLTVFDVTKNAFKTLPSTNNNRGLNIMGVLAGPVMVRQHAGHSIVFLTAVYTSEGVKGGHILFRIDLDTGEQTIAREGAHWVEDWLVDDDGQIVSERTYSEPDQRWSLSIRRGNGLSEIMSGHEPVDAPTVLGFGPDEGTLLTWSVAEGDSAWKLLSLKDGTLGPALADGRVLDWPIEDVRTRRMIGGVRVDDAQYVFFDDTLQQRWASITRAFSGERVRMTSHSADFNEVVVRVDGSKGYRYELVDLNARRAEPLGEVYAGVGQPLEIRRITYPASDGLEIPAYLTLPRGREPKNLPLVVLPHGGPAVRDTPDFDWWSQALADQGYAVLRPNYRGSYLNWKFQSAGFGQWGRKMQTDLSDGVRYLAKEGTIDPARVCIFGASYGGYAALAGVTLESGVYRCAISVAGLSDLKRMLHRAGDASESQRYWDRFMGAKGPDDPLLDTISPIKHVNAVSVPVLLIHGKDDAVVPFDQSSLMYEALKRAQKNVQLIVLEHEDHWLSRSQTRLQMLQSSVAFLRANNPPD